MKFGQDFQAALAREEFPQGWIDSAISYKKLKKCVKRVQQELLDLGLDHETLNSLWQQVGKDAESPRGERADPILHYSLNGNEKAKFVPKLTIAIDPRDGSPMDAWLSPETRRALRRMARSSKPNTAVTQHQIVEENGKAVAHESATPEPEHGPGSDGTNVADDNDQSIPQLDHLETIEIPLTSDSEFFQILRRELADLDQLQTTEQKRLQTEILQLGRELRALKDSKGRKSKEEIEVWRKVFEMYTEAQVFLSSHEQDAGARDATHAQNQLQLFTKSLAGQQSNVIKLGKDANGALDRFLRINMNLLRLIKFQEINRTALTKIMKKFDKRTALHARTAISSSLTGGSLMSKDLAKATCFTISRELLQIIPQLDDYLCPVCFSITWKPVRLRCQHVFCIRCLIVMQRAEQDHCPLCRGEVVLEASSDHLDKQLMTFLKKNFKQEVKDKQKANEIAAGIDRWGAQYEKSQKCIVM